MRQPQVQTGLLNEDMFYQFRIVTFLEKFKQKMALNELTYYSNTTLSMEKIPVVMRPLEAREAMFLTGKLIDRQDFSRNLLNRSSFLQFLLLIIIFLHKCYTNSR